jgi:D-3-phosphoglycerate dehydrogenase / 2-oxoglutarate reductase
LRLLPPRALGHHGADNSHHWLRKLEGKATPMPKVLVIQPFHEEGMKLLETRSDVTCEVVDGSLEELAEQIADADGVTIRTTPLPGAVIERAARLKVVSRHGVGYDNIDVAALSRRGIPLAIAADANATAVAEHTLYFMLALAKHGLRYDRATRAGRWAVRNSLDAVDLMGRRVLVMGFGRIGREVAKRCAAFGMQVMVYDPYVQANVIEAAGDWRSVPDFEAVLPETDVLTVHMPLGADSRGMIGAAELAALPKHAFVINAARGGIVDEAALHDALTTGKIAGAALDVFDQEPPPDDHPLFTLDNVILTPHSAGLSKEAAIRMAISTAKNVLAGIDGKLDPAMVVNCQVL